VCAAARPCAADADCPLGAPHCLLEQGRCVACRTDADCAAASWCADGRCTGTGACEQDADCPGARACAPDSTCAPLPDCAGDRHDGLDEPPTLRARTHTGLLLCDGATDRYRVTVPAGHSLVVWLRHAADAGDANLTLTLPDGPDTVLSFSDMVTGVERAGLDALPVEQHVDVLVQGRPGANVPYELDLRLDATQACTPDSYEGLLGNDVRALAAPAGAGVHRLHLCPNDVDWLSLDLSAGTHLLLRAAPEGRVEDLVATLSDPAGQQVAQSENDGRAQVIEADIEATGRYGLRLQANDALMHLRATVSVTATPTADADALVCAAAQQLVAGEPLTLAPTIPVDRALAACGIGAGSEHLASFTLDAPAEVRLEVLDDHFGTTLAVYDGCPVGDATEQACTFAAQPVVDGLALQAGTYTVLVETGGGLLPRLLLSVP